MVKASTYTVTALEDKVGMRVDRYLADAIEGLSRSRIQVLIAAGWVTVDGAVLGNASAKVRAGQRFHVDVPAAEPPRLVAEEIPLTVVYEDADVVVVDKPAGLVVHPAFGHPAGTLVNALFAHCGDNLSGLCGVTRPGIVHRLDKDTSGLIVAAKNDRAHAGLSEQFAAHSLERAYQALVWGVPRPAKGEISGHYHPKAQGRTRLRTISRPAFLVDCDRVILPAFGTFTGGLRSTSPELARLMHPDALAILTGPSAHTIRMPR